MSVIYARERAKIINRMRAGLGFLDDKLPQVEAAFERDKLAGQKPLALQLIDPNAVRDNKRYQFPQLGPDKRLVLRTSKNNKSNKATARGFAVFENTILQLESQLERRFALSLLARTDIVKIYSQFPRLPWTDENGEPHVHTADFFVQYRSGLSRAFVVKMEKKREKMEAMIARIKAHGTEGVVDDIRVATEVYATYERAENSKWILWSRRHHNELEIEILKAIVMTMPGWFRFGDLLRNCNDLGARRVAIWRLIDSGFIFAGTAEKITEWTWLHMADA